MPDPTASARSQRHERRKLLTAILTGTRVLPHLLQQRQAWLGHAVTDI